jgi:hypothetical protein
MLDVGFATDEVDTAIGVAGEGSVVSAKGRDQDRRARVWDGALSHCS